MSDSTGTIWYIPTRALALAKARELKQLLAAVADRADEGPGSPADYAMQGMDDVIGYLMPDGDDG